MKQIKRSIYGVTRGELVTVEVQAMKTGNFVHFILNSAEITPTSVSPLTFQFSCPGAVNGDDFAMVSCFFPPDTPDDAEYQLFLTGSGGGGRFEGSDILKADGIFNRGITFIGM